jgi:hypothetical protein
MITTVETVIFKGRASGRLLSKRYKEFLDQLRNSLFLNTGYSMELIRLRLELSSNLKDNKWNTK